MDVMRDVRTLDCAEGVLRASKRHRLPRLRIAAALVALAEGSSLEDDATAAARYEWGSLFDAGSIHRYR